MAALPKAAPKSRVVPLGTLIDGVWEQRESKRRLEAEIKLIEANIASAELALIERLDKEGVDSSRGKSATASISTTISASIDDWDTFTAYVAKTKQFHLLQKRVSDPAARELFETKGSVPGLSPFTKRKVNIRTLS